MKFKTKLVQGVTKNVVGFVTPDAIIESFARGKRPPVKVTINGYTYRSTVAVMGGKYMVGISAEHRAGAGVQGGDTVQITIELDREQRDVIVPKDLAAALRKAKAYKIFETLAPSRRKEHVRLVEDAKAPETRLRRIEKIVREISETDT